MFRTNLVTESNNGTSCSCSKLLKGLFGTYPILQCVTSCPGYLNLGIAVDYYINNFNYASRQPVLTNQKHVVELLHTIDLKRR